MSLDTAPPATSAAVFRSVAPEPSGPTQFRHIVAAEWTKLRSVRSTKITLAVNALVCIGLGVLFCYGVVSRWDQMSPAERARFDPASFSLNGLFLGQLIIGALGVLVISAEYSTGTIRATLGAIPQRRSVLTGKAVVFAGVVLVVSLITSFAAFFLGQLVLHGKAIDTTLGQPSVLRVVLGGALFLTAVGLLGLGLGTLLRNTAAGISVVVGLLFVLPILANFLPSDISVHVMKFLPGTAGMGIWSVHREANALSPWVGFALLCGYALAALIAGAVVLARRDA